MQRPVVDAGFLGGGGGIDDAAAVGAFVESVGGDVGELVEGF